MTKRTYFTMGLAFCGLLPGLVIATMGHRGAADSLNPAVTLVLIGLAVWLAATMLGWAGEALETDISGPLALALLAIVAILPEYMVDVNLAFSAGTNPEKIALASANMNGATRLLVGFALPVVVLVAMAARRRQDRRQQQVQNQRVVLDSGQSEMATEHVPKQLGKPNGREPKSVRQNGLIMNQDSHSVLAFCLVACLVAVGGAITGQLHFGLGIGLLVVFGLFLWHSGRGGAEEPELVGVAAQISGLPKARRLGLIVVLFLVAAGTIFWVVEPFVDSLIAAGDYLGVPRYFMVKWLAPIASEAPEVILALTLAAHRKPVAGVMLLVTAITNQWSALVGSLPVAFKLGGGDWALPLTADSSLQIKEFLLTGAVTAVAIAFLLGLRIPPWAPFFLLATFVAEFVLPTENQLLILAAINAALALALVAVNRKHLPALIKAPFKAVEQPPIS
ncbi:MAG: hypothetical protein FWG16_06065 [Micrococcales bacterium]|nr:hypothetical protein [Micrococcales bacterium]